MIEVQKKRRRRRRRIAFLLVAVLAGSIYVLGWSNVFSVKRVVVLGAPSQQESLLIRNSVILGERMARLEPKNLNTTLDKFGWLDKSSVSRNWFSGVVTIHVWPRTPIATSGSSLVDRNGNLFDLPGTAVSGLPSIVSSSPLARMFATELINNLPKRLLVSVLVITTSGSHSAQLTVHEKSFSTPRNITINWGDISQSDLKSRVYYSLIGLPENQKISLVDVSAPHAPIVK